MLKDRKTLEQYLDEQCDRIIIDNIKCKAIYTYANDTYEIPKGIVSDFISKRMSMSEASEFVLFILLDSMNNVLKEKKILGVDNFYTMQEAKHYKTSKYEIEKIKLPLVFKMIQVEDDQWIGKITVDMLMKLRRAQLINYNTNAQRTMQRIVRGDKETYKISLNKKAVKEIQNAFEDNSFIPNTITLNIPLETENEFYYNESNNSLVINSLEHLDITDGFHRFIAAGQIKDKNPNFDYQMELRITNFMEDKAKQFIYQEDQKTPMRKIDSRSMNMNSAANMVVTRLNENVRCNLKGLISRNEGTVSFGELSELIDYFYFKGISKEKERSITIQAVKELTENFNLLTEYNTKYLEQKMNYKTLLSAMFCFDYFKEQNLSADRICEIIEATAEKLESSNIKSLKNKTPRKSLMADVQKIVEEVM